MEEVNRENTVARRKIGVRKSEILSVKLPAECETGPRAEKKVCRSWIVCVPPSLLVNGKHSTLLLLSRAEPLALPFLRRCNTKAG